MRIIEDKGQKVGQHIVKNQWFESNGIEVIRAPLPVGDYIALTEKVESVILRKSQRNVDLKKMDFLGSYAVAVDTKKDLQELYGNLVGKQHARFRDECILAQTNGIKLIVLVENTDGIEDILSVAEWANPRVLRYFCIKKLKEMGKAANVKLAKRPPASNKQLIDIMLTMQQKYGCQFEFTTPHGCAERILNYLKD